MEIDLIKSTTHFSRAELPEMLSRVQGCLQTWLKSLPKPVADRLRKQLPKLDPRRLPPALLGAIDEEFPLYKDSRDNLIKLQCYWDHRELHGPLSSQPHYLQLGEDLGMLLLVNVLQDFAWLIRVHREARRRKLGAGAVREYVQSQFILYIKEQEWMPA